MKRYIAGLTILILSITYTKAQFEFGASTGAIIPNYEYSLYSASNATNIYAGYQLPLGLTAGVDLQFSAPLKVLVDEFKPVLDRPYDYESVSYNTAQLNYQLIPSLYIRKQIKVFKLAICVGLRGGLYKSALSGSFQVEGDGYQQTVEEAALIEFLSDDAVALYDESYHLGWVPELSLRYKLLGNFHLQVKTDYHIILSDYQQHLMGINGGLIYIMD